MNNVNPSHLSPPTIPSRPDKRPPSPLSVDLTDDSPLFKKSKFTNAGLEDSENWPDVTEELLGEKKSLVKGIFGTDSPLAAVGSGACPWTDSDSDEESDVTVPLSEGEGRDREVADFDLEMETDTDSYSETEHIDSSVKHVVSDSEDDFRLILKQTN